jgi:hypothetical protein
MCMWFFCVKLFLFFEESCNLCVGLGLGRGVVFVFLFWFWVVCVCCLVEEGVNLCESFVCFLFVFASVVL